MMDNALWLMDPMAMAKTRDYEIEKTCLEKNTELSLDYLKKHPYQICSRTTKELIQIEL